MCAIAGALCSDSGAPPVDATVISRLGELMARRGPDGAGLWAARDGRVVLGHRRLAVIDIGPGGAQPMTHASGRWIIVFNGEIYNYRELRAELEHAGQRFSTQSDTEVLIGAVAHWGEAGLAKLRGMFAFALWDSCENELWLARDPYGIKPLYVARAGQTTWFASQARALAAAAPIDARREAAALAGFYLWGHVPEPFSWWTGITMFPAGHVQRIACDRAPAPPRPFFTVQESFTVRPASPLAPGELSALMRETVRQHLVADVPVGVFLSAGIDSTVIAALGAELGVKLRTITLAFDDYRGTDHDEAPLAEETARSLRTEHVTVRLSREEFMSVIDDFIDAMDQPTIDGLNTYLVSRAAAAQGLKVALSGAGGDELFGGYPSFAQIPKLLAWRRRIPAVEGLSRALDRAAGFVASTTHPKAAGLLSHSRDIASAYLLRRALHLRGELDAVLDASWVRQGLERLATVAAVTDSIAPLQASRATAHAQVAALEACWYMRNQLLRDTDWASMAHGLEVRLPFVDATLIRHLGPAIASAAPPTKRDLLACAPPHLHALANRRKTGFTTPVRRWIAREPGGEALGLRGWADEVHRRFRASLAPNAANALAA
jgi:asparagine synthase (glutamine-hydrolysing)